METKAAITITYTGIRILSGVMFLISEIKILEQISTKVAAKPIPIALFTDVEVANVGHIQDNHESRIFLSYDTFR